MVLVRFAGLGIGLALQGLDGGLGLDLEGLGLELYGHGHSSDYCMPMLNPKSKNNAF